MKKYLALVLAAVTVLLTLAACGANVDDETTAGIATEKASEYVQPSYEEVSGVEMIEGEKINVTLLKFTSALGYRLCFNPEKFATSLTSEAEYFRWVIEYDGLTPFFEVERTQGKVEDVCAALAQKKDIDAEAEKTKIGGENKYSALTLSKVEINGDTDYQYNYYFIENGGDVFTISTCCSVEAVEGIGASFEGMLDTFEIVK